MPTIFPSVLCVWPLPHHSALSDTKSTLFLHPNREICAYLLICPPQTLLLEWQEIPMSSLYNSEVMGDWRTEFTLNAFFLKKPGHIIISVSHKLREGRPIRRLLDFLDSTWDKRRNRLLFLCAHPPPHFSQDSWFSPGEQRDLYVVPFHIQKGPKC